MSLRTYKKKELDQKEQEQSKLYKKTSELLACERQFSMLHKNTIEEMRERHSQQLEKLEHENETLVMKLDIAEEEIHRMEFYLHSLEEEKRAAIKAQEWQWEKILSEKVKKFKETSMDYEKTIDDLEKKVNAAEIEINYLKNHKKPKCEVATQTLEVSRRIGTERTISLREHLATVKSLKQEFLKEKFEIQEAHQERLSEVVASKKKEVEYYLDRQKFDTFNTCEGSRIVATIEQQKSARDKKKMQELIEYYLNCLEEKNKQCCRQQDFIQRLQGLKKRQELKIQDLTKMLANKRAMQAQKSSNREHSIQQNAEEASRLAQRIVDERSEIESLIVELIQQVKEKTRGCNEMAELTEVSLTPEETQLNATEENVEPFTPQQKEDILKAIFTNMNAANQTYNLLKTTLSKN